MTYTTINPQSGPQPHSLQLTQTPPNFEDVVTNNTKDTGAYTLAGQHGPIEKHSIGGLASTHFAVKLARQVVGIDARFVMRITGPKRNTAAALWPGHDDVHLCSGLSQ